MTHRRPSPIRLVALAVASLLVLAATAMAAPAQFVIVNINDPGVGFNDPTPAAPVGGNTGTTLGEQRLIAFNHAAAIWSARLDSAVPIRIRARFIGLNPGVLGSAGPLSVFANFPNAPLTGTWYHVALANKLAGVDLAPGSDDIAANFSTNFTFYLGLDNNHGPLPDLVAVLLHEFAHGLGFSQFSSLGTGAYLGPPFLPDVYLSNLLDTTVSLHWSQMTDAQRLASATNWGRVVWDGAGVTATVPGVLTLGSPNVEVTSPASIAGVYQFGTAAFGPPIGTPNVSASVVAAIDAADAAGPTTTDGCSPFDNAAAIAGQIALVERGTCPFALKARNASAAGAVAVIIYNNAANATAAAPGMAGDPLHNAFVTAPTVSVNRPAGLAIAGASGVTADIGVDLSLRAGADSLNRARVYAPFPVVGGSSISHFDTVASRNLLMEPAINPDLTHNVKAPFDMTWELLHDIGWTFPDADGDTFPDDEDCNPNSDVRPTIIIDGIDTGVPNRGLGAGCTMADMIVSTKAASGNHGSFVSAIAHLTNEWMNAGLIGGSQKGAIQSAAANWQ